MPILVGGLTSARAASAPAPASAASRLAQLRSQCDQLGYVPLVGQGPSCEVQNHWFTKLHSGKDVEVAPPDTIAMAAQAAAAAPASSNTAPLGPAGVACATGTHQRVELIYAHFAGSPDNVNLDALDIEQQFLGVDQAYLDFQSRAYFATDAHLWVECNSGGGLVVHDVALSTAKGSANFSTIVSDVQNAGYCESGSASGCTGAFPAHYWIWTDGNPTSGYAGQSSVIGDDSAGTGNAINSSDGYSVNYGFNNANGGTGIFAHENGHAMGAVQLSAPDSSGAWHCTDGLDVMCYNDGGSAASQYTTADCADAANGHPLFDCNFNDYFNPAPPAGSYLASHWNIGSSNNAWMTFQPIPSSATAAGSQLVFWRAANGHLIESWYTNALWNPALDLTTQLGLGPLYSAPSVAITPDGSQQLVFFESAGGDIDEIWYAGGRWNGPLDLTVSGFGGPPAASAPSVTVLPDGSQELVFWTAGNGQMYEAWWANSRWNGPQDVSAAVGSGPPATSAPDVAIAPDGSQQTVYWRAPSGDLYEAWWANARWYGPMDLTATIGGPPSDTTPSVQFTPDESQQLVYWDSAGQLFEGWWANARWYGPLDVSAELAGAGPASAPSVAVAPDMTQQVVFWQAGNGDLFEAWWAGGRWNGPADMMFHIYAAPALGSSPSVAVVP